MKKSPDGCKPRPKCVPTHPGGFLFFVLEIKIDEARMDQSDSRSFLLSPNSKKASTLFYIIEVYLLSECIVLQRENLDRRLSYGAKKILLHAM